VTARARRVSPPTVTARAVRLRLVKVGLEPRFPGNSRRVPSGQCEAADRDGLGGKRVDVSLYGDDAFARGVAALEAAGYVLMHKGPPERGSGGERPGGRGTLCVYRDQSFGQKKEPSKGGGS
jgi:hypothetical protein